MVDIGNIIFRDKHQLYETSAVLQLYICIYLYIIRNTFSPIPRKTYKLLSKKTPQQQKQLINKCIINE